MIRVSARFSARQTLRNCATPVWLTYIALSEVAAWEGQRQDVWLDYAMIGVYSEYMFISETA
jgi:hypothetical protein